jgi:hypothetical protein
VKIGTFKMVFVRGNTPEEQAAEIERLKQAGHAGDGDWFIYEPRNTSEASSEIIELPVLALRQILQEIDAEREILQIEPQAVEERDS